MNTLVAIVYPDENQAFEVLKTLEKLQKENLLDLADAVYLTKDKNGKVKMHQSQNLPASGAIGGSILGLFFGMLFLAPWAGMAIGAGLGALSGAAEDYGIDDTFMKDLGNKITPGSSAIFILVRSVVADKVVPELSKYGGQVLRSSLSAKAEKQLQESLNAQKAGPVQAST